MSIGITWIGSMGFTRYLIYFHPLKSLSYVFGYNYEIVGEDGLFANVNYGFLIFLLPILSFGICMIVGKIKYSLAPTQEMKLFLLLELSFAWLCINSIMVAYGMYTETFTKTFDTGISIASMVFGVIYLVVLMIASILFVRKEDSFSSLKYDMNLPKDKGPIYYVTYIIWTQLAMVMTYLFLSYYFPDLRYTPLIIAGICLVNLALIVVLKPYKDTLRLLFNQIILFMVFLCYFMIREVEAAEWSGFAILVLLYVQTILNFIIIGRNAKKNRDKREYEDDDEDSEVNDEEMIEYQAKSKADPKEDFVEDGEIDMDYIPKTYKKSGNEHMVGDESNRRNLKAELME